MSTLAVALGGASLGARPAHAAGGPQVQGMAIEAINNSPAEYDRLVGIGTNTLYIPVYWEVDSQDANSVHPYADGGTVNDAALAADIRSAGARGMRVALMPMVECNCPDQWRGHLQPSDPHAFLQSYTQMVVHYGELAQQSGGWLLYLGSEMNTLQGYADDWRQMAAEVRQVFPSGLISYQPNWDHISSVPFWDALDIVSISAYFPLTATPSPTVGQIKQAWHSCSTPEWQGTNWFAQVQALANATRKPLLIGEVGYRSSTTGAARPWEERTEQTPDQVTQANAYQALLETFSSEPWWMGVIWWQWRGTDQDAGSTDMSPLGKQAEQFLHSWWVDGWRPPAGADNAPNGGRSGSTNPARGANVLGSKTTAPAARPTAAGVSTATSPAATTQQTADPATTDPNLLNGGGFSAAAGGPRSVARRSSTAGSRGPFVAVALVVLLGMLLVVGNQARVRIRTPRPRPLI